MIALLSGKIVELEFPRAVIDVNGVGYEVFIPMSTYDKLPHNGQVTLKILTVVREDAITLYGFATKKEKSLFLLLNTVSGIGPKLSLNILSALPVSHICTLIAESNIAALSKINGLGKKTAERLSVELREKVANIYISGEEPAPSMSLESKLSKDAEDAISALSTLGYKDTVARKTVVKVMKKLDESEQVVENLIRKSLQLLNS